MLETSWLLLFVFLFMEIPTKGLKPLQCPKFILEVCKAIIPKSEKCRKEVAAGFTSRWNYYNYLGAMDGKHIAMKKPSNFGPTTTTTKISIAFY